MPNRTFSIQTDELQRLMAKDRRKMSTLDTNPYLKVLNRKNSTLQ